MLFADVARASAAIAATRSRNAKRDQLADLLRLAQPAEVGIVARYLAGELRQRRTGVGWASVGAVPTPAQEPTLDLIAVDRTFENLAGLAGPGSQAKRSQAVTELFARATEQEQKMLRGLITGELRQGALDAVMLDAVAAASEISPALLRRAAMLSGSTAVAAEAALGAGGAAAVAAFQVEVGRPVRPMLAGSAPGVAEAYAKLGPDSLCVDVKIDGIRIQAHKSAAGIRLFTRSLDEISLPDVAEVVAALPADSLILDGEVLASDTDGRPRPFQETAAQAATQGVPAGAGQRLVPAFFDILYANSTPLIDEPLSERARHLEQLVPEAYRIRRLANPGQETAQQFFDRTIKDGHEGVVIKSLATPYQAGRRGSGWIKVKPRHTLDLVVLAVERGSGRRRGLLSNIHLGARDPGTGQLIMVGKTFKGMTDEMLAWQTRRFTELAAEPIQPDDWVILLRPEQVVEIAIDGVQRSPRYPGGVALRFARVLRYRDDKAAAEADTIDAVRALGHTMMGAGSGDES